MISRSALLLLGVILLLAVGPVAAVAKDGGGEVRAAGVCGRNATSELRLKRDDDRIEVRFRVAHTRARSVWRVTLVHERRIAWRRAATTGRDGSFEVRRALPDLPGADTVSARALGPRGLICRVTATLPDS